MTGLLVVHNFYPRHPWNTAIRKERKMKFVFDASITFNAVDIDDAFKQLEGHFRSLQQEDSESPLEFKGKIDLKEEPS